MGESSIEWTDFSWNPITGCKKISAGCANCYAIKQAARMERMQPDLASYQGLTVVRDNGVRDWADCGPRMVPDQLTKPIHWRKGHKVFVCSMSDLFHVDVPFEYIDRIFAVMALCPQHVFQVLTKRPDRMAEYFASDDEVGFGNRLSSAAGCLLDGDWVWKEGKRYRSRIERFIVASLGDPEFELKPDEAARLWQWPLPNVWLGTSVEDQKAADERIVHLLKCPAEVRFLSVEPLLGPVKLWEFDEDEQAWRGPGVVLSGGMTVGTPDAPPEGYDDSQPGIDWVICGGESGDGARPMSPAWARSIRDQCFAASVPFFFKQWGAWQYYCFLPRCSVRDRESPKEFGFASCDPGDPGVFLMRNVGKEKAGRHLDGRTWDEMPEAVSEVPI